MTHRKKFKFCYLLFDSISCGSLILTSFHGVDNISRFIFWILTGLDHFLVSFCSFEMSKFGLGTSLEVFWSREIEEFTLSFSNKSSLKTLRAQLSNVKFMSFLGTDHPFLELWLNLTFLFEDFIIFSWSVTRTLLFRRLITPNFLYQVGLLRSLSAVENDENLRLTSMLFLLVNSPIKLCSFFSLDLRSSTLSDRLKYFDRCLFWLLYTCRFWLALNLSRTPNTVFRFVSSILVTCIDDWCGAGMAILARVFEESDLKARLSMLPRKLVRNLFELVMLSTTWSGRLRGDFLLGDSSTILIFLWNEA